MGLLKSINSTVDRHISMPTERFFYNHFGSKHETAKKATVIGAVATAVFMAPQATLLGTLLGFAVGTALRYSETANRYALYRPAAWIPGSHVFASAVGAVAAVFFTSSSLTMLPGFVAGMAAARVVVPMRIKLEGF